MNVVGGVADDGTTPGTLSPACDCTGGASPRSPVVFVGDGIVFGVDAIAFVGRKGAHRGEKRRRDTKSGTANTKNGTANDPEGTRTPSEGLGSRLRALASAPNRDPEQPPPSSLCRSSRRSAAPSRR